MSVAPKLDVAADPVARYLDEIGRTPLLTSEEEIDLARTIEAGKEAAKQLRSGSVGSGDRDQLETAVAAGRAARDHFVRANLRLVVSIASRYRSGLTGLDLLDLFQEGNIGLMRAVEKYDWRRGFKFSTYATWWIRQAVQRALLEKGRPLRISSRLHDAAIAVKRAEAEHQAETGRRPGIEELVERSGLPHALVDEVRGVAEVTSLESPIGENGAVLGDFVALDGGESPELVAVAADRSQRLRSAIARLGPRERVIMLRRFGFHDDVPRTLAEIGAVLGLSAERVYQLERAALCRLRHPSFGLRERDLL